MKRLFPESRHASLKNLAQLADKLDMTTSEEKNRVYGLSQERGLGLSAAYPTPVNEIPEIRVAFDGQPFPAARSVADTLLTIPTHHWLSEQDKRAIADCVSSVPERRAATSKGTESLLRNTVH